MKNEIYFPFSWKEMSYGNKAMNFDEMDINSNFFKERKIWGKKMP